MARHIVSALTAALVLAACAAPEPEIAPPPPAPVVEPEPPIPERFPAIQFESGVVQLTPAQRQQVREMAETLKRPHATDVRVLVEGHADSVGSERMNRRMSRARAEAVMRELVFNGISPARITIQAHGSERPVAPNALPDGKDNPQGRALNRRVEVVIQSGAAAG